MKHYGLQQVLATTPILFCAWMGLQSRMYRDPFEFQTGNIEQDAAVLSYEYFVREERRIARRPGDNERERILVLAHQWVEAVDRGVLRPLQPVSHEDHCNTGPRKSVFRSKTHIVDYLVDDAESLAKCSKHREATNEALLALRLSESLKYGDFDSISSVSVEERRTLAFLSRNLRHLDGAQRERVQLALLDVTHQQGALYGTLQASNARFYDYKRRITGQFDVSDIRQTSMIGRRLRNEGKDPKTLKAVRRHYLGCDDPATLDYLYDLRLAWRNAQETQNKAEQLLKML